MHTKTFLISTIFFLMLTAATPAQAQEAASLPLFRGLPMNLSGVHAGLQVGSMYYVGLQGGGIFSQTIAPSLNWEVGKRFNLEFGTILSSSTLNGSSALFPYTPHMAGGESIQAAGLQHIFGATFYAAGAYQVNPRLTLTGGAWMDRSQLPDMYMNPMAMPSNFHGANFGFDYRVSGNFSFGAQINVSSGYNPLHPFYNNAFRNYSTPGTFHSPFPFHQQGRW